MTSISQEIPQAGLSAIALPETVNFHLVAHCNYRCRYCFAHFEEARRQPRLSLDEKQRVVRMLAEAGCRNLTFVGGEPTLEKELHRLLRTAAEAGLVTSVITNGSRIDDAWIAQHGPWLRWLGVSIDSVDEEMAARLGRRTNAKDTAHLARVRRVAELVHARNSRHPEGRIFLKVNVTVTSLNVEEDPSDLLRELRPDRVKIFQMLEVEGENDSASDLRCDDAAFERYVARVSRLKEDGITIQPETSELMRGSYAMLDPEGRFFQHAQGGYNYSPPVVDVGVLQAWRSLEGFVPARFIARGANYDHGRPARGPST